MEHLGHLRLKVRITTLKIVADLMRLDLAFGQDRADCGRSDLIKAIVSRIAAMISDMFAKKA
jgi:hypothetical protein